MTRNDIRIARELTRIARTLVIAGMKEQIQKTVQNALTEMPPDIRESVNEMLEKTEQMNHTAGAMRFSAEGDIEEPSKDPGYIVLEKNKRTLSDYVKKVAGWVKNNKIKTTVGVAVIAALILNVLNGCDMTQTVKEIVKEIIEGCTVSSMLGGLGVVFKKFFRIR